MLTSILPGIRQVRAPFVAGAIILAAFVLLLGSTVESVRVQSHSNVSVQTIVSILGRPGCLAVAGVSAYVLGALSMSAIELAERWINSNLLPAKLNNPKEERGFLGRIVAPFSRLALTRLIEKCDGDADLAAKVQGEILRSGGKRLLVANKDLYLEYDRVKSEVELRRAIAIPGVLLVAALAVRLTWPAVLAVVAIIIATIVILGLAIQARLLSKDANSMYGHAVADGLIGTPSLDRPKPTANDQERFEGILAELPLHRGAIYWLRTDYGGFDSLKWSHSMMKLIGDFVFGWKIEVFDDKEMEKTRTALVTATENLLRWSSEEGGPFVEIADDRLVKLRAAEHRPGGKTEFEAAEKRGFELADLVVEARQAFERTGRVRGLHAPLAVHAPKAKVQPLRVEIVHGEAHDVGTNDGQSLDSAFSKTYSTSKVSPSWSTRLMMLVRQFLATIIGQFKSRS